MTTDTPTRAQLIDALIIAAEKIGATESPRLVSKLINVQTAAAFDLNAHIDAELAAMQRRAETAEADWHTVETLCRVLTTERDEARAELAATTKRLRMAERLLATSYGPQYKLDGIEIDRDFASAPFQISRKSVSGFGSWEFWDGEVWGSPVDRAKYDTAIDALTAAVDAGLVAPVKEEETK